MLFKAQAANLTLTTPKAFTLTLGTLAHFRHFLLPMTKDEVQRRRWTFYEAVKNGLGNPSCRTQEPFNHKSLT